MRSSFLEICWARACAIQHEAFMEGDVNSFLMAALDITAYEGMMKKGED